MRTFPLLFSLFLLSQTSCLVIEEPHAKLAPGLWRGVLKLDQAQSSRLGGSGEQQKKSAVTFEEVTSGELPFHFEVNYTSTDSFKIVIINGTERIILEDIHYGLDRRTAKDTLVVHFPLMDSYLEAVCESGVMQGYWVVNYKENYRVPFEARFGEAHRFTPLTKQPKLDLTGNWAVQFEPGTKDAYPAIAEFKQTKNHLSGTFRTETGDFRFLEGSIQANKIYLSSFDGAHAYLFEGKIQEDYTIHGIFRSGSHYLGYWEGKKDDTYSLANPDSLTIPTNQDETVVFSFPDINGQLLSTSDSAYHGKPMIIQILGTWCPNCLDESLFLKQYIESNPSSEVAVVGIAFERYRDSEKAQTHIKRYAMKLDLPYKLVLGGYFDKKEAGSHLPFLKDIKAYPTMIFLNKDHKIVRIHTGFDGPATSKYQQFTSEFNNFVHLLSASQ